MQNPSHSQTLWHFHGGLHLPEHKEESTQIPITAVPFPKRLVLPLQQHIGVTAEPLVKVGERVWKGQAIARPIGYVSAPVHASTSGTVTYIGDQRVPHPSGLSAPCIVIESDGEDAWQEAPQGMEDYRQSDALEIRNRIRQAGIVGLGGAAFPSAVKLNPGPHCKIHALILNAAECEPYITCDDMLMRERPQEILEGVRILLHVLDAQQCLCGIEDNKKQACDALVAALAEQPDERIRLIKIPTLYPSGGEKQLIKILTGKEVPSNGLPAQLGLVCHNAGTAAAVARAIQHGEPLISRIVTVTGAGVDKPRNLEVRLGTPIREVIEFCGGYTDQVVRLIMGGPMMGFALRSDEVPIVKGSNCVLAEGRTEAPQHVQEMPCIRCGACAEVCPANLLPQQLYWYTRAKDMDKVQDYHLFDCIECGCCAYVCPSQIPLVQYYRFAKTEIWAQERERIKADLARRRHEARKERLEREQREREERLRKKRQALHQKGETGSDPKKAVIEAAVRRAQAKQAARQARGSSASNHSESAQDSASSRPQRERSSQD